MRKIVSLLTVLLFTSVIAFAQQKTASGVVRNASGDPVPFATVAEAGTNNKTQADVNGAFNFRVKSSSQQITISSSGYDPITADLGENRTYALKQATKTVLPEVVVSGGFIKRQSREVGTATTVVNVKELNQASVVNAATGLAGKVAGLNIQTADNGVNPQVRVTLRGNRSILGNNQALIVVDGNIVDNAYLARLNPSDIDNVTILKGAGASAIYGSDASNGVFVVTTKRGNNTKPRINISSTAQFETISYMPKLQERFGSFGGEDTANYGVGFVYFPNDPNPLYYGYENQQYGPEFNGQMVPVGMPTRIYNPDGTYYMSQQMAPYAPVKNGKYNFFDKGLTLQNSVSYSAGNEGSNLYFSFQNVKVNGIVPLDVSNRNSLRINGSKSYGKFRIDFNSNVTLEKVSVASNNTYSQAGRSVYWNVINQPQHVDIKKYRNWRTDPYASLDNYYNAYYGNPYWAIDATRDETKNTFTTGNLKLNYKAFSWLDINYTVGYTRRDISFKATREGYKFAQYAIDDACHCGSAPSSVKKLEAGFTDQIFNRQRLNGDLTLTFNKTFGKISTKLLLGNTVWKQTERNIITSATALVFDGIYNLGNRVGEPVAGNSTSEQALMGNFADLTLGYNNWAFVHGSVRRDQTSVLAPKNRTFTYPAVDASLVLTDAIPALKNSFLYFAKLRGGWAKVGQVSVGPYSLDNTLSTGAGFPYGTTVGFTIPGQTNNPLLKPEFTTEKEVGIELGFLKNRIMLNASYYNTVTINQTVPRSISASTGYTTALTNIGSMENKGYEVELRLTPFLKLGQLSWNLSGNYSRNDNKVGLDLPTEILIANGTAAYAIPGKPYPYSQGQDWKRDPQGRIIVNANDGYPTRATGNVGFGTTVAPTRVGLTSSMTYKGFTFNVVADGRFGAIILNDLGGDLDFTGVSWYSAQTGRTPAIIPNSVIETSPGKFEPNTNVVTENGNHTFWAGKWNAADAPYVNSADYWKIREISFGYDFPSSLFRNSKGIQAVNFTINARNFFMFRPKDNVWTDPEFSAAGTGNAVGITNINQTPPTRIFGATLNVTF
ncbi:MAG: SusC/RagA family TonB-linked outer membrane protein [Ferruginibacter sp.]|nr:SusC/RagA family TonB-linked outer membrane protein [Ferruginibacter sp.]